MWFQWPWVHCCRCTGFLYVPRPVAVLMLPSCYSLGGVTNVRSIQVDQSRQVGVLRLFRPAADDDGVQPARAA